MGGVKKCAVCKRSEKLPGVRLFSFPRQKYRCDQWLQNIGNPDLYKFSTYRLSIAYKVCEQHFERNCFFSDMLNRLVRDAVPTLFGPNVKQHVAIDNSVLKHQPENYSSQKLLKFSDGGYQNSKNCNNPVDRMPCNNSISVSVIGELEDSLLLQEDEKYSTNSVSKLNEINCNNEITQSDFSKLNTVPLCSNKVDHASDKKILSHKKVTLQVVDEMCETECKEFAVSENAHLAYPCRIETNGNCISDSDEASMDGFVQEGFLNSWMVDDPVLNEDDNTSALFHKICEQVSNKKDFAQDISEAEVSFNDESETVNLEERNLEEEQFSEYMDVGSMHGLDQSDFLHNWMRGGSIANNKVTSSERLSDQQCTLSDIGLSLMNEGRGHEKTNSVNDIIVCSWENEKISTDLSKLTHENYEDLEVCEEEGSDSTHYERILIPELCSRPVVCSGDELPISETLSVQTINENQFHSAKVSRKKSKNISDGSKGKLRKTMEFVGNKFDSGDTEITSDTITFLPIESTFDKDFQTVQVVQQDSVDKLFQVEHITNGIAITKAGSNHGSQFCDIPKKSIENEFNQNVSFNDLKKTTGENVVGFDHAEDTTLDVSLSDETSSDDTNYVIYNFESICRLCLAAEEFMYPIFSDSDSMNEKDVVSCIPVKVQKGDMYPKLICKNCYDQMASWLKFKEVCFNSQSILEQLSTGTSVGCPSSEKEERNLFISLPAAHVPEKPEVISRSTQTVPMVELLVSEEQMITESGMVQQNKENDLLCQKFRRRQLTLHKKRMPCDVKIQRVRGVISSKQKINRGKNCIGIEASCGSPSTIPSSQRVTQNKGANVMKQLHISGLKPGCHLTVADKRYLIVGTKSGPKNGVDLYAKQHFCSETDCNRTCKTELCT